MDRKPLPGTELELSPFGVAPRDGTREAVVVPVPPGQASWIEAPLTVTSDGWRTLSAAVAGGAAASPPLLIRVPRGNWDRSMIAACRDLPARIDRPQVDLWQLDPFDLERIKAGEPFRRMGALRDEGLIRWFSIRVSSVKDAVWCIEHTPVHVLTVDAPLDEAEAAELFSLAAETQIGLLGTAGTVRGDPLRALAMAGSTPLVSFAWPG